MYILLRWVISAAALLIVAMVVPGFHVGSFGTALIAALVLGLLNLVVRPLLLLLTLPINILTLGLFTLVVNALVILIMSSVVKGVQVDGFAPAFWGAIILWLIGWVANTLLVSKNDDPKVEVL